MPDPRLICCYELLCLGDSMSRLIFVEISFHKFATFKTLSTKDTNTHTCCWARHTVCFGPVFSKCTSDFWLPSPCQPFLTTVLCMWAPRRGWRWSGGLGDIRLYGVTQCNTATLLHACMWHSPYWNVAFTRNLVFYLQWVSPEEQLGVANKFR